MKKNIWLLLLLIPFSIFSQKMQVIDGIIATVGNQVVLKSELEKMYYQSFPDRRIIDKDDLCVVLEELLFQKMLVHQSDMDSIVISEEEVEGELDRRLKYFISQAGSKEKLEAYYNKTIEEIKTEISRNLKDQLAVRQMQSKIIDEVKITPSEVRIFFNSIHKDSLPIILAEVEIAQIVKTPQISETAKEEIRKKLNDIKARIANGEDFPTLAIMYSEDPGSARKGGELGFTERGTLYPEFEKVAYSLDENEISDIVETKAGYHIVQLIKRRGEEINVRHILLKPKVSIEDNIKAKMSIDSVYNSLINKEVTFEEAIAKYSDDDSKQYNGVFINPETGSTKHKIDELESSIKFTVENLRQGDFSKPILTKNQEGNDVYKIILIKTKSEKHKANLKDDYLIIQQEALTMKQNKIMREWIDTKKQGVFINISDDYTDCEFQNNWLK